MQINGKGLTARLSISLISAGLAASISIAAPQQSPPKNAKSWSESAKEVSRVVAEKKESCGQQARERKLKSIKRLRFIRGCVRKID
jgi:hypothetical protein